MSNTFDCSACGQAITADVGPGQQVICPFCEAAVTVPGEKVAIPGAVPPQIPGAILGPPQLKTGLAITAMILGNLGMFGFVTGGLCAPVGLIGLILGIVALVKANKSPDQYGGKGMAIAGICIGAASIIIGVFMLSLMLSIMVPSLSRAREMARRTVCTSNLQMVGTALLMYAEENNGSLPPDLDTLVGKDQIVSSQQLICPENADEDEPYIYIRVPTLNDTSFDKPLVIENPENHGGEGSNVVFGDGHTEWVEGPRLEQMLEDAGTGIPLPSP